TLMSANFTNSPQGLIPKLRRFVVVANYSSGIAEYETGLAYVALKDAQKFFGMGDAVSGIDVMVKDPLTAEAIAKLIAELLCVKNSLYSVVDWTEPNKPLMEAIRLEKSVYFKVLLLLILVASFSIVSTLVMLVMEKSRDIAILKSMGASDRSVLGIF